MAKAHCAFGVDLDLAYEPAVSEGSVRALAVG
jgi:hypothetical protein